jgi:hypothetical protein
MPTPAFPTRPLRRWPLYYDSRTWKRKDFEARRPPPQPGRKAAGVASVAFVAHDHYKTSTGVRVAHAHQYVGGLRVYGSAVATRRHRGRLRLSPAMFRLPRVLETRPKATAEAALQTIVGFLRRRRALPPHFKLQVKSVDRAGHVESHVSFVHATSLAWPASLHLEVFPLPDGHARLVWVAEICFRDFRRFHVVVSADRVRPKVLLAAQTNTCAFTADWVPEPTTVDRGSFPVPVLATPTGGGGSPSPWQITPNFAHGTNVNCVRSASTTVEALGPLAVDNTFVWCNLLHDLFAAFGFDHAHFAFEGDDPVRVLRFTGAKAVGGEFDNRADGIEPHIRLHGSPHVGGAHAATDPTIVVHEYVHGVTSRLIGGRACPTPFVTVESQGLSEGLSDYFALTIVNFVARSRGAPAVTRFGERFKPGGLRDYGGFAGTKPSSSNDPYKFGMPWCAGLLDARQQIAAPTSDDEADRFLWLACIDSLKAMSPLCHSTNSLTLAHAASALVAAARLIEASRPQFAGAADVIAQALHARGI